MKKVKIFSYRDEDILEYAVNDFIAKCHNVLDIQFQAFHLNGTERYAAMVIYEE